MNYQSHKKIILETARNSIEHGLQHQYAMEVPHQDIPDLLLNPGACFVTLEIAGQLRGCIGSIEAYRPLIDDISANAYASAFSDPRFNPVSEQELQQLDIHVSILTPATAMEFKDEQDLIAQIQPGIDGLIIEDQGRRGTFLPSVWESLPDVESFLKHLKLKAGLPEDYWSDSLTVHRYGTEMIDNSSS